MYKDHLPIVIMRVALFIFGVLNIWITHRLAFNVNKAEAVLFKFSNAKCQSYNESWIYIHQCRLKAVSRNVSTFNFNATVLYPANDIRVQAQVFQKANGFKPWLFKVDIDACRFMKKRYNPFAIVVFNLFKDFTNCSHTCPYMGPQIVDGLYPRWNKLPHAIPTGEYLLTLTWLFDKRIQFFTNLYFTFTEDM